MTKEEKLFNDNVNLIHFVITTKCHINLSSSLYEDLYQQGSAGLWKACNTYNGSNEFSTYAIHCIFNEIRSLNNLEANRIKKYNIKICSLENEINDNIKFENSICSDNYEFVKKLHDKIMIDQILNMDFKNKEIVIDYYLNDILKKDLAKKYNITRNTIARRIQAGIEDLKEKLKVGDDNGEKEKKHSKNNKSSFRH